MLIIFYSRHTGMLGNYIQSSFRPGANRVHACKLHQFHERNLRPRASFGVVLSSIEGEAFGELWLHESIAVYFS